jgi:hypothetical protein
MSGEESLRFSFQYLRCLFGKHAPDRNRARTTRDHIIRSVCKGCGRPMIKKRFGWALE